MLKNRYSPHLCAVILMTSSLLGACSGGYLPGRVYVPNAHKAGQVDLQASTSQSNLSYALNDEVSLSASGVYRVNSDYSYKMHLRADLFNGELGAHYSKQLTSRTRFVLGAGTAIEYWMSGGYRYWRRPSGGTVTEFVDANSFIITPSAQAAFVFKAFTLFGKLSAPLFLDDEASDRMGRPLFAHFGIEKHIKLAHAFGMYTQLQGRPILAGGPLGNPYDTDSEFSTLPVDIFFGFTYLFNAPKERQER